MTLLLEAVGFGVVTASVLAMAGVGFTMQIGITNMFNLTYGTVMVIAAFAAYGINRAGVNIWLCLFVAAACGVIVTTALNRVIFRPFLRRGTRPFAMVIVTVATAFVLQYGLQAIWGANFYSYSFSPGPTLHLGPFVFTVAQLGIIALAVVSMFALHFLLHETNLGRAMRATAANAMLARACGIRTNRVIDIVWALTGAFCGVAGVTLVMSTASFDFTSGSTFMIVVVAAAILGGAGQPYGAMVGALIIGLASQIAAVVFSPDYNEVVAFGVLVLTLLVRPQGLLGAPNLFREQQEAFST